MTTPETDRSLAQATPQAELKTDPNDPLLSCLAMAAEVARFI